MTGPRIWPPFLDWRDNRHWNPAGPAPCVLCGQPALLLSDHGRPSHKTCAEDWYAAHPDAWEFYERRHDHETQNTNAKKTQEPDLANGRRQTARRTRADTLPLPDAA
jgi:hypothetical protein